MWSKKYKAQYELLLKKQAKEKKIQIYSESIIYWQRGASWKTERNVAFLNPYYDTQSILENMPAYVISNNKSKLVK